MGKGAAVLLLQGRGARGGANSHSRGPRGLVCVPFSLESEIQIFLPARRFSRSACFSRSEMRPRLFGSLHFSGGGDPLFFLAGLTPAWPVPPQL